MDQTNERNRMEAPGRPEAAPFGAEERAERLERLCRSVISDHYEECLLIDVSSRRARALPERGGEGQGCFLSFCGEDCDAGLLRMAESCAWAPEDGEALRSLLLDALLPRLREEGRVSVRLRLRDGDGEAAWKQVECSLFQEGEILMLVADVREEEATRQQLRDAAEEAEAASRAKSAFLANMSHEIRTPMNAIVGISEVLLRRELPQDVLEALSTIQNSGSSLLGIINDILDFSKIETGLFEIT